MAKSVKPDVCHRIHMGSSVPCQEHLIALVFDETGVNDSVERVAEHAAAEAVLPSTSGPDAFVEGPLLCRNAPKSSDLLTEAIVA